LADARAAAHVFLTLVQRLQERGVTRLGEARAYVSPAQRSVMSKLSLTRDLPNTPGAYRFLDAEGRVLYVGKADRLREQVRSHFAPTVKVPRKLRQAARLVERIDWEETGSPLEAVVREHELILQHRPYCNVQGRRPEAYAYLKVVSTRSGLVLGLSNSFPIRPEYGSRTGRHGLLIGPFRGRARLQNALDLLQTCYPIRRCARRQGNRPCLRGHTGSCLAPCVADPDITAAHDTLVERLVLWLVGHSGEDIPDPLTYAEERIRSLARQRRYEESRRLQAACEDLQSVRRSYLALAEARQLCFAALWPLPSNGAGPSLRLNVVVNGKLRGGATLTAANHLQAVQTLWDEVLRTVAAPGREETEWPVTPLPE
ncbi:MAG: hypothetical protein H5T84_03205, partial [Thermoleophilia bacterium]|nr:hypothetical protein [Thermoleophilia bacterium]